MVGKLLDGGFEAARDAFHGDVFIQIVDTIGVAINTDLNLVEGGEAVDAEIRSAVQALHLVHAEFKLEVLKIRHGPSFKFQQGTAAEDF